MEATTLLRCEARPAVVVTMVAGTLVSMLILLLLLQVMAPSLAWKSTLQLTCFQKGVVGHSWSLNTLCISAALYFENGWP